MLTTTSQKRFQRLMNAYGLNMKGEPVAGSPSVPGTPKASAAATPKKRKTPNAKASPTKKVKTEEDDEGSAKNRIFAAEDDGL